MAVKETIESGAAGAREYRRANRTLLASMLTGFALGIVGALRHSPEAMLIGFVVPMAPAIIWLMICDTRMRRAFREMGQYYREGFSDEWRNADVSSLGALIEFTMGGATLACDVELTARLLINLLETAPEGAGAALTQRQWGLLYSIVTQTGLQPPGRGLGDAYWDTVLTVQPVAVRALGAIGNTASIRALQICADETDDPGLRRDALHSIEQIQDRLKYGQDQMLRASSEMLAPNVLLRTAPVSAAEPDELLRPGNCE